ncbi:MAG: NAD regulator [Devosiaceae bacterium]|nr:NAD regulator [Devosiaceae bacterium MH13]
MSRSADQAIGLDLTAAVVALVEGHPAILTVGGAEPQAEPALPSGPFAPLEHRTLELGLRGFVEAQTGFRLGYIEQLYTFGDRGRHATGLSSAPHVLSIGYVGLTRAVEEGVPERDAAPRTAWSWQGWYRYFPWEDWRSGRPPVLDERLLPGLQAWLARDARDEPPGRALSRRERVSLAFGASAMDASLNGAQRDDTPWDEERVLERYELLYEAGLVVEAVRDGRDAAATPADGLGRPMALDHRRILATAIARLRGKMKYRPVVFEVMPATFTLTDLQLAVEAIAGRRLHKQNFRRLVDRAGLVEQTGATTLATGGRPAALYRFRRDVVAERPAAGLRLGQPVVR